MFYKVSEIPFSLKVQNLNEINQALRLNCTENLGELHFAHQVFGIVTSFARSFNFCNLSPDFIVLEAMCPQALDSWQNFLTNLTI